MIVRLRSPEGVERVVVKPEDDVCVLYKSYSAKKNVVLSYRPNDKNFLPLSGASLSKLGIKNGDMLFIDYHKDNSANDVMPLCDDDIDKILSKRSGEIKRGKGSSCRHGDNAMCDNCMPLPPYDENYTKEKKIKHLSIHSYIRKLMSSKSDVDVVLEEPSFLVNAKCQSGHAPFPKSMCAKCQPSAIVLQQQSFRHVDHVEFESSEMVDSFISFWRSTGLQRFGYLYGRYEPYDEVPLGIKAVVSAIYEPAQKSFVDGVELDEKENVNVDELARMLNLKRIGLIYTDLMEYQGTKGIGLVAYKRNPESFFLSSAECIFIGRQQLANPNRSKYSHSGYFGSKFVSVIVSGDEKNQIHLSAYQISVTGMALIRDEIIDATLDPNLISVRDSTSTQYIPEVFYKYQNKYGVTVQEVAKPTFPLDYLLVTLTEGVPQKPTPYFMTPKMFVIEHRPYHPLQDIASFRRHYTEALDKKYIFSDFHLLLYLKVSGFFTPSDFESFVEAVMKKEIDFQTLENTNQSWQKLMHETFSEESHEKWNCKYCTFTNRIDKSECAMCGLPK